MDTGWKRLDKLQNFNTTGVNFHFNLHVNTGVQQLDIMLHIKLFLERKKSKRVNPLHLGPVNKVIPLKLCLERTSLPSRCFSGGRKYVKSARTVRARHRIDYFLASWHFQNYK